MADDDGMHCDALVGTASTGCMSKTNDKPPMRSTRSTLDLLTSGEIGTTGVVMAASEWRYCLPHSRTMEPGVLLSTPDSDGEPLRRGDRLQPRQDRDE
jgi:hypothetical protein